MMPTLLPFPNRPFAPAPTAIPQLFDEGECHNTLGVNQTQRQAEQTIQCVCGCLCKNQSLRVSLAFGCQQLSGDAESVRASAQGGVGQHRSGLPSPPAASPSSAPRRLLKRNSLSPTPSLCGLHASPSRGQRAGMASPLSLAPQQPPFPAKGALRAPGQLARPAGSMGGQMRGRR